MDIIKACLGKLDVSELILKKKEKSEQKQPSLLKDLIDKPEGFKLEAFIENNEIIVKIIKRES